MKDLCGARKETINVCSASSGHPRLVLPSTSASSALSQSDQTCSNRQITMNHHTHKRTAAKLMLLTLVSAACQDSPVSSSGTVNPAKFPANPSIVSKSEESPYVCYLSTRTPDGPYRYSYTRRWLQFPASARASDEGVATYRVRIEQRDETVAAAVCRIPATAKALEMTNRYFGVGTRFRRREDPADGAVTIQSCPAGTVCLDPIVVVGPGPSGPSYPGGGGGGGGECWWDCSSGDSWGGGSFPYDPASDTPAGEPVADDDMADCHSASGSCDLRAAHDTIKAKAVALAQGIRSEGVCGEARSKAIQMIDRLQIWTNELRYGGILLLGDWAPEFVSPTGTDWIPVMHLWADPRGFNAWTIAHEGLHGLGKRHEDKIVGPDGVTRSMDQTAKYCSLSS